jgi:hypothetical protein
MKVFGKLEEGDVRKILIEAADLVKGREAFAEMREASRKHEEVEAQKPCEKDGVLRISREVSPTQILIGARSFAEVLGVFDFVDGGRELPMDGVEVWGDEFEGITRQIKSEGGLAGFFREAYQKARARLSEALGIRGLLRGYCRGEWRFV